MFNRVFNEFANRDSIFIPKRSTTGYELSA